MNKELQLECYDCGFVGIIEDFTNTDPPDLVELIENQQKKAALRCPDCEGQQLGPLDDQEILRL